MIDACGHRRDGVRGIVLSIRGFDARAWGLPAPGLWALPPARLALLASCRRREAWADCA